jgi:hypothetical protein
MGKLIDLANDLLSGRVSEDPIDEVVQHVEDYKACLHGVAPW